MSDFLHRMAAASARRVRPTAVVRAPTHRPPRHGLIAEVKQASPSDGPLAQVDVVAQARAYEAGGAAAISVLTEPTAFGGSLDDLRRVAEAVDLPVMRKDFIVHPHQVCEAAAHGASMVLLVVRLLDDDTLDRCLAAAEACGLTVLLEAFDAADLARLTHRHQGHLVGVNTRDLATLKVCPERLGQLADHLPTGCTAVAESGLRSPEDARRARRLGYPLALVGTALMRSPEPSHAAALFSSSYPSFRVKVCGLSTPEAVDAALDAGADAIGLVLCDSPRRVAPARARQLLRHVGGRASVVGVTRQLRAAEIDDLLAEGFDALQGRVPIPHPRVLSVVGVDHPFDGTALLDLSEGRGQPLPRDQAAAWVARGQGPRMVAGGLTPDNVADVIAAVRPHGVDVSSGVEDRPGHKNLARIHTFVQRARRALDALPAGDPHVCPRR